MIPIKIIRSLLFVLTLICFGITIYAFWHSWKAGLIWLIALVLIFLVLGSFSDNTDPKAPKFTNRTRLIVMSLFLVSAFFGVRALNFTPKVNTVTPSNKEEITSRPIKINAEELGNFQTIWADSIVKDWQGIYIKKFSLSPAFDTIYFQLSKAASKGWGNTEEINQSVLQKNYDSLKIKGLTGSNKTLLTLIRLIPDPEQKKENLIKAERKELILKQFSLWNGANNYVQKYIKENMNDPESYEHIQTNYEDKGSYILVNTKFRGNNGYGGTVIQIVSAKVDLKGNILSVKY